ncbi:DUF6603 domain-containing protein [Micromonospora rifamycinica]|uniref:DUF6603 domain-containing protein n=3 Tax=Micromonospora rifamycinica TaxID=291594 RepID=A0A1C5KG31_9ACTN|nr:DUF6603 domain-containing protein [Micromonospora rifamycinica]SCG81609.1 hypothetical protein GA0070623_5996 [Micromonospora rifamycinica]
MSDLDALYGHLESMGRTVTLAADDSALPVQLAEFLRTMPDGLLELVPGDDGLSLSGQVLTISGGTSASWPIEGLGPAGAGPVHLTHASVTLTGPAAPGSTAGLTVTGAASGVLDLDGPVAVTLTSTREQSATGTVAAWRLGVPATTRLPLPTLLALGVGGSGRAAVLPVPPQTLVGTASVEPAQLHLTFYPGRAHRPRLVFTASLPDARWTVVPAVLAFDDVTVRGDVGPAQYQLMLSSLVTIGDLPVEVTIGVTPGRRWTASLRPSGTTAFPGLAALAGWLGGAQRGAAAAVELASLRGDGPGLGVGGLDAAIRRVTMTFDAGTGQLPSVQVVSLLTLGVLRLDVAASLPDLEMTGQLYEQTPVGVAELLDSLGLPSADLPRALTVSEAFFLARPRSGRYAVDLTLSDVWRIGPVALRRVSVGVAYQSSSGLSGYIEAVLSFGPSINVLLQAGYEGAAEGWRFAGSTGAGDILPVGDFLSSLAADFGITEVPDVLRQLALVEVAASVTTGTGAFTFSCTGALTVAGAPAQLRVDVALDPVPAGQPSGAEPSDPATTVGTAGFTARYSATLTIGRMACAVTLNLRDGRGSTSIDAHWTADPQQPPLSLTDVAAGLDLPVPELPPGLDLTLTAADLTYDPTSRQLVIGARSAVHGAAVFVALPAAAEADGSTRYLAAVSVGEPIGLSDLPLIGAALGDAETCAVEQLQVIVSDARILPQTVVEANGLIGEGYPRFPEQGTAAALAFSAVLRFGAQRIPIALGAGRAAGPGTPTDPATAPVGSTVGPSSGQGGVVAAAPTDADGTVWFTVQKAFGPVTIARVGARYRDAALWFVLDGSLEADGLSLALQGASIRVPVAGFGPRFDVRGLALSYVNAPLAILGGFTSVPPTGGATFRYDGGAAVSMPSWGALAYGSYTEVDGEPSMFLFLRAAGTFGGPPAFSVTALAAGFGYNSTIRLPAVTEVAGFPLVAGLGAQDADGSPAQALAALTGGPQPWLSPAPGQTWLAAGVRFHTYRQFDTTALLAVEFGNALTVLLLGVTTARFPSTGAARPYAQLQLELRSVLRPGEGIFALSAGLTRNSYLLDPACVLTGGFAFYAWFGEHRNAGDFAVTIGGYHPAFDAPEHYPVVPRVGFTWSLDAAVRISGTAYFALTPSAIMAGGTLDVRYHDGSLTAWFTAQADLLVAWAPFRFRTRIGVSVGIEYTANLLFTAKTLHLEAGAELELWGPPTGGTVTVRLWVVTFTVAFGATAGTADPAVTRLDWAGFQELLPAATASTTFTAAAGLAAPQTGSAGSTGPAGSTDSAGPEPWPVRADGFAVTLRNAVPVSRVLLGSTTRTAAVSGPPVDVRPLGRTGLTVQQRVTLRRTAGGPAGEIDLTATGWHAAGVASDVPTALWGAGDGSTLAPGGAQLVPDRLTGLTLTAPPAVAGWTGGPVDAAGTLGVARITADDALPLTAAAEPVGAVATHAGAVAAIAAQIAGPAAKAARAALFAALGVLGAAPSADGPVDAFAADAGTLFTDEPMLTGTAP